MKKYKLAICQNIKILTCFVAGLSILFSYIGMNAFAENQISQTKSGDSTVDGHIECFEGTANNIGDGDLNSKIILNSNISGSIGTGAKIHPTASPRHSTITGRVTDDKGETGAGIFPITIAQNNDNCPADPGKTEPGECGCGIPEGTCYSSALMVTSGSGGGRYKPGITITIKANNAESGKVFDRWVVNFGNPSVVNLKTSTTILTMPVNAATVTATYKNLPPIYALTINNGSGDGSYTSGSSIIIKADTAPSGKEFDCWVVNYGSASITNGSSTTFLTMPSSATTLTATYKNLPPIYTLTINNGSGGGSYTSGTSTIITANTAPLGQEFDHWVVNSGNPSIDSSSSTTFLTMQSSDTTLTAKYKIASESPEIH